MGSCLLTYECFKEDFLHESNKTIYDSPKNNNSNCLLLTEILLIKKILCLKQVFICLSFYCLWFLNGKFMDMLDEKLKEQRGPDPELREDIIFWTIGRSIGRIILWRILKKRQRFMTLGERYTCKRRSIL